GKSCHPEGKAMRTSENQRFSSVPGWQVVSSGRESHANLGKSKIFLSPGLAPYLNKRKGICLQAANSFFLLRHGLLLT
ncbi:hypothetical protein AALA13_16650, partial [Lachnospiraceae bacterium 50-23]